MWYNMIVNGMEPKTNSKLNKETKKQIDKEIKKWHH